MNLSTLPVQTKLPFSGVILPTITISPEDRAHFGAKPDCTNLEFLTQLCRHGFREKVQKRVPKERHAEYGARVTEELGVISELGFVDYILSVWDVCHFADKNDIPRGPGRGSVGGCMIAYLCGITELDPIEHGLFFTRFLSKARAKFRDVDGVRYIDGSLLPDIDLDFGFTRRSSIIDYLNHRYPGQTSKLLTTSTFTSKILIKDVLKVYSNADEQEAIDVADVIDKEYGTPELIEDAIWGDPKWRGGDKEHGKKPNERFLKWAESHMEECEIAMALSGLNRSEGQHASAVLISHGPIRDLMSLQLASSDGERVEVSGYDMYSASEITEKLDILGLRTLDVIDLACKRIGIKRSDIDVHDPSIYAYLQNFKHRYGIFQLETFAQGSAAARVKPRTFEQLGAVLAVARPGALSQVDKLIAYVNDGVYNAIDPLIDDVLKVTGGICLYQEQLLQMCNRLGMSLDESEGLRRAIGKKDETKVAEYERKIKDVAAKNGHSIALAELVWKIAEDSAGYQFNKSHSICYASITAVTLWLKANHPLIFYHSLLQMASDEAASHSVVAQIEQEMRMTGFELLPPHFIKSDLGFKIESDKSIRFALSLIRGISEKNMERMQGFLDKARVESLNKFEIFQAIKNAGLNIGIACALIQAGCMDGYDSYVDKEGKPYRSRSRLVLEACTWNQLNDTTKKLAFTVGAKPEVNWDVIVAVKYLSTQTNEKGKPLIPQKSLESLRKKYAPHAEIYTMNSRNEALANYFYERKVLGYSYSQTLATIFGVKIDGLKTCAEILEAPEGTKVKAIGFVADPLQGKTLKGNAEFKFRLLDETGELRVKAFNDKITDIEKDNGRLPEDEDLVILTGKKMSRDTVFLDRNVGGPALGIQTSVVYTRLTDLERRKKAAAESNESLASITAAQSPT